jgi:hypothetical protein
MSILPSIHLYTNQLFDIKNPVVRINLNINQYNENVLFGVCNVTEKEQKACQ